MPSFLGRHMRRRLRAGAGAEDLQGRCPHFYDAAQEIAALTPADETLPAFVFATFQNRYRVRPAVCRTGGVAHLRFRAAGSPFDRTASGDRRQEC